MANVSSDFFGFEILNKLVEPQVSKKEDVVILFAHWFFVKNGFRCIGLGDSKTFEANEKGSELLPERWSQENHYALRYVKEEKLYVLLGRKSDADLLLNFLRIDDNSLSTIKLPVNGTVSQLHGPLEALIPNHPEILQKLQKELAEPVYTGSAREISTQTTDAQEVEERRRRGVVHNEDDVLREGPRQLRTIGRHDLDPFAPLEPGGGGMIFDPFRPAARGPVNPYGPLPGGLGGPARLPPGAIPGGARFDPFGPPDLVRPRPHPRDPDHDHERPPMGYDDMFM